MGVKCTTGAAAPRRDRRRWRPARATAARPASPCPGRRRRAGRRRGGRRRRQSRAAATGARRPAPSSKARRVMPCARCGAKSSGNSVTTSKRMAAAPSVVRVPVDHDAAARRGRRRRRRRRRRGSAARRASACSRGCTRSTLCGPVSIRPTTSPSASPPVDDGQADQVDPVELAVAGGRESWTARRRCGRRASASAALRSATSCAVATTPSPCSRACTTRSSAGSGHCARARGARPRAAAGTSAWTRTAPAGRRRRA